MYKQIIPAAQNGSIVEWYEYVRDRNDHLELASDLERFILDNFEFVFEQSNGFEKVGHYVLTDLLKRDDLVVANEYQLLM